MNPNRAERGLSLANFFVVLFNFIEVSFWVQHSTIEQIPGRTAPDLNVCICVYVDLALESLAMPPKNIV